MVPVHPARCSHVKTADTSISSKRQYLRIHQATPVLNSSSLNRSVPQQLAGGSALPRLSRPPLTATALGRGCYTETRVLHAVTARVLLLGRGEGHTKKSCRQMAAHPKQLSEGTAFGHAFPSVWGSRDKAVAPHRRERTRTSFPERGGGLREGRGSCRERRPPGRQRGNLPTWSSILRGLRSRMLAGMVLSISSSTLCKEASAQRR